MVALYVDVLLHGRFSLCLWPLYLDGFSWDAFVFSQAVSSVGRDGFWVGAAAVDSLSVALLAIGFDVLALAGSRHGSIILFGLWFPVAHVTGGCVSRVAAFFGVFLSLFVQVVSSWLCCSVGVPAGRPA